MSVGFRVGQRVGFKRDYERSGTIARISAGVATVREWDSDRGEYVETGVMLSRLWSEEDEDMRAL